MAKAKPKFDTKDECLEAARELGNKKKFNLHDLYGFQPKTENQRKFFDLFSKEYSILVLKGFAGVGKSALAFYAALTEVFDESTPYDKLVLIRSAVETRKIGFMPGDYESKAAIFEAPYVNLTKQFVKYNNAYDNMKALGFYEFALTSHLRGMTFDNCIVILEEAQNMDYSELHTAVTRMGINSRLLITGDSKQDDLKRHREKSGFDKFNNVLMSMPEDMVATIDFTVDDVVRSNLVKQFLIADSKFGGD